MNGQPWYGDFFGNGVLVLELVKIGYKVRPGRINFLVRRLRAVRGGA